TAAGPRSRHDHKGHSSPRVVVVDYGDVVRAGICALDVHAAAARRLGPRTVLDAAARAYASSDGARGVRGREHRARAVFPPCAHDNAGIVEQPRAGIVDGFAEARAGASQAQRGAATHGFVFWLADDAG